MQLYELAAQYQALLEAADEGEGAFTTALDQLGGELAAKAVSVAKVIKTLEAEADVYTAEMKRLQDHVLALGNSATRLKGYLRDNMVAAGLTHIQGDVVDLRIQEGPPAVSVINEALLDAVWKRARLTLPLAQVPEELVGLATVEVDKRAILDFVKAGNPDPAGTVVARSSYLRIR